MKRTTLMMVLFFSVGLMAQTSEKNKTSSPATKADVSSSAQKAIKEIKKAVSEAEKKNSVKIAAEHKSLLKETGSAIESSEKKLEDKLKAELAEKAAKEKTEREEEQKAVKKTIVLSTGVLGAIAIFSVWFLRFKSRSEKKALDYVHPVEKTTPEILVDPDVATLRAFSQRNGGITKIPFILTLDNGMRFNCLAELREGLAPLVYFDKLGFAVAWDKRRQKAASLTS